MMALSAEGKVALDDLLTQTVESRKMPNICFGATTAKENLYFNARGSRVFNESASGEIDKNSVYWICSETKTITSIAIIQLIEKGKISMETPVSEILPELADPIILDNPIAKNSTYFSAKTTITVKHLLNHSSGMFYYSEDPRQLPIPYTDLYDTDEDPISRFFALIRGDLPSIPLMFEPGTDFSYGYSTDCIGFIIERLTGQSLEEYCQENIFMPIGLTSITYCPTPEMVERAVSLSIRRPDKTFETWKNQILLKPQHGKDIRLHLGGIGLHSTMNDILKLMQHILQIYAGCAVNPILILDSVKKLFIPTLSDNAVANVNLTTGVKDGQWGIGLCLNTTDWPGARRVRSGWWSGWAGTYHLIDPITGIACVFGTQLTPPLDPEVKKAWWSAEKALYTGLTIG
ncbi:beta-lactamase/transpeptidase-like protein [Crucibulum laeve]|uniref:Beta-lactamase/transpeptidase-like protein n=1 Tax=Crucibulum laeve TaxID=68775 RepID=A0A5C3LFC8_9AGAR|nr:beta-lactamase/transpeptidase-like protein [Crucibulum laeve]